MNYVVYENYRQASSFHPGDAVPEGRTLIAVVTVDQTYYHGPDNYTHQSGFVDYDWSSGTIVNPPTIPAYVCDGDPEAWANELAQRVTGQDFADSTVYEMDSMMDIHSGWDISHAIHFSTIPTSLIESYR